jgi:putative oxidoreductase
MTQDVLPSSHRVPAARVFDRFHLATFSAYLVPLGRLLFTLIFLESVPMHFSAQGIAYAAQGGTPLANILVPLSGVLVLLGGLSVLLGYHARIGALLLALFLLPVTLIMHDFWNVADPGMARMQMVMFMKNVSLFGSTLLLMHFGAGPLSIDATRTRRL